MYRLLATWLPIRCGGRLQHHELAPQFTRARQLKPCALRISDVARFLLLTKVVFCIVFRALLSIAFAYPSGGCSLPFGDGITETLNTRIERERARGRVNAVALFQLE